MASSLLEEKIQKSTELVGFSKDVLGLLSPDKLLQRNKENVEAVAKVGQKVDKAKQLSNHTIKSR